MLEVAYQKFSLTSSTRLADETVGIDTRHWPYPESNKNWAILTGYKDDDVRSYMLQFILKRVKNYHVISI